MGSNPATPTNPLRKAPIPNPNHRLLGLGACTLLAAWLAAVPVSAADWIAAWSASPSGIDTSKSFVGQTFRQRVHLDGGGRAIRLRLGNALSGERLILGAVRVATPAAVPGATEPGSDLQVTFAGRPIVAIPPYATILSDPLPHRVDSGSDLIVSLFVAASKAPTKHDLGSDLAFVAPGDQTRTSVMQEATTTDTRVVLSGIDVEGEPGAGTIVALGDSITDGFRSTQGLDRRWPDVLARRLKATPGLATLGVANAGIAGNQLLRDGVGPNALSRLPRDVLALPGLRFICLLEGINDIGAGAKSSDPASRVTAADLIAGYQQIVAQAHEHGAKVLIGTLTPFSGSGVAEKVREAVNAWIRAKDGFDGVLDFDAALHDPGKPSQMLASFDSGDHLHPNDAGYAAMADVIDLDLFK